MSKGNILIVEDSFIVAYHLQITLEGEGYTVIGKCDTAEGALNFIQSTIPDLVLMDIMLDGEMDGVELASLLNKKFDIPVIYITALTDQATISRAKTTEPYGYLTKPFEDLELFTAIEMALYKHGIESKLRASEQKYFSTLKSINDCVIVIGSDFKIIYANPSVATLLQTPSDEIIGKLISEKLVVRYLLEEDIFVNPLQCALGRVNLNAMQDDLVFVRKDGLEIPIGESSFSVLINNLDGSCGLVIVFREISEKMEYQKLLKSLEKQRLISLIEGQEKERSRIAKDLHDGLGQILNAIKMNASVIAKNDVNGFVFYNLIDEAIQECVRISENLLPSKLKDFDLSTCLRSLCSQVNMKVSCHVGFAGDENMKEVSQSMKINLYRIAQEAINNALKHATAKNIAVQLREYDGTVHLSIVDDGHGLSLLSESDLFKHNGLVNMRDRSEIMGGKLKLESNSVGTLIRVEVPLIND